MEDILSIAGEFGIEPQLARVYKTKYFYTVKCPQGEYRLIPTALTEDRLKELYQLKEGLLKKGLNVCDRQLLTVSGEAAARGAEGLYIMTEAVKGHNLRLEDRDEMRRTFSALGAMHCALREMPCGNDNIFEGYKKGLNRLKTIKKQLNCSKRLTDFDTEFLKQYKEYYTLAENALSVLEGLNFAPTCPIHGAIKEDNIFMGRHTVFTDWEMSRPGHFMEDVASLVYRYVRKQGYFDPSCLTLEEILSVYTKENPCGDRELAVLYALLMYPKRFISVCSKYYGKAHRFAPVSVRRKFRECVEQREFYLKYIGVLE